MMYAIDKILFTSDNNINYLSFWNSISKFYSTQFHIRPHLFFLGEKNEHNEKYLSERYGDISIIEPIKDIPIIIQSLWGKFWFTQIEPDTKWLIGDIDLYLLNKEYLDDCLGRIFDDDSYSHLNANGYKRGDWWLNPNIGLPGYWHLAKGKIFKQYLELSDSFEKDCRFIFETKKYGILFKGLIPEESYAPNRVKYNNNYGYICCEENLSTEKLIPHREKINSFTYPRYLPRLETRFANSGLNTPCGYRIANEFDINTTYIDFHAPRPYECFAKDIEDIIYAAIKR